MPLPFSVTTYLLIHNKLWMSVGQSVLFFHTLDSYRSAISFKVPVSFQLTGGFGWLSKHQVETDGLGWGDMLGCLQLTICTQSRQFKTSILSLDSWLYEMYFLSPILSNFKAKASCKSKVLTHLSIIWSQKKQKNSTKKMI